MTDIQDPEIDLEGPTVAIAPVIVAEVVDEPVQVPDSGDEQVTEPAPEVDGDEPDGDVVAVADTPAVQPLACVSAPAFPVAVPAVQPVGPRTMGWVREAQSYGGAPVEIPVVTVAIAPAPFGLWLVVQQWGPLRRRRWYLSRRRAEYVYARALRAARRIPGDMTGKWTWRSAAEDER